MAENTRWSDDDLERLLDDYAPLVALMELRDAMQFRIAELEAAQGTAKADSRGVFPCPFCGDYPKPRIGYTHLHWLECLNPDCTVNPEAFGKTPEEAVAYWNTRTVPKSE